MTSSQSRSAHSCAPTVSESALSENSSRSALHCGGVCCPTRAVYRSVHCRSEVIITLSALTSFVVLHSGIVVALRVHCRQLTMRSPYQASSISAVCLFVCQHGSTIDCLTRCYAFATAQARLDRPDWSARPCLHCLRDRVAAADAAAPYSMLSELSCCSSVVILGCLAK